MISSSEAKTITGEKYAMAAFNMLYQRIEARTWTINGKTWRPSGMISKTKAPGFRDGYQPVFFVCIESLHGGGASWERVARPLDLVIDCISGNLDRM